MNSPTYPILTTERLSLRQLLLEDREDIFALRSDAEINKFLGRAPSKTIDEAISFINTINENIEKGDTYYWAITLTASKTIVGTICLFDLSVESNSCEIGYELMTKFQGKGIMKEAVQVVIDFVFNTLQFNKILAYTHYENQASTNLLLKFKFLKSAEMVQENPDLNIFILTQSN